MSLIFGKFSTLPFFSLQVFGALVLISYMIWDRMKDLKREVLITNLQKKILELEKNNEITVLKSFSKKEQIKKNDQSAEPAES